MVVRCVLSVACVLAVGCGRIGFDRTGTGAGADALDRDGNGGANGDVLADATSLCGADGFCPVTCGVADPDCQTTCGDTMCVGNAGEHCTTCTADCQTTTDVCGNSTCSASETSATCPGDCGPSPWSWTAEEDELFVAINAARTNGTACPGMVFATAPAVTLDPALVRAARDLAWEQAQHSTIGVSRCSGQTMTSYLSMVGANGSRVRSGDTTTSERMASWTSNTSSCPTLMDPARTRVGVAIAIDTSNVYVALFAN